MYRVNTVAVTRSLPAPVHQSSATSVQSGFHVLAGLQEVYWSDDDAVCACLSCSRKVVSIALLNPFNN